MIIKNVKMICISYELNNNQIIAAKRIHDYSE